MLALEEQNLLHMAVWDTPYQEKFLHWEWYTNDDKLIKYVCMGNLTTFSYEDMKGWKSNKYAMPHCEIPDILPNWIPKLEHTVLKKSTKIKIIYKSL